MRRKVLAIVTGQGQVPTRVLRYADGIEESHQQDQGREIHPLPFEVRRKHMIVDLLFEGKKLGPARW